MNSPKGTWLRFILAAALLTGAGAFLRSRGHAETLPAHKSPDLFPTQLSNWQDIQDVGLSDDVREILGDGDFMEREYSRNPAEPPVDLFIAYFPTQRAGDTMHSPQHCLPGAGWMFTDHSLLELKGPDGPARVNLYLISKGMERQVVLYWYQAHGRIVASEYWAKVYLVTDAIRMNRTDGALVRVIAPVTQDESVKNGEKRAVDFASRILPILDQYIPR